MKNFARNLVLALFIAVFMVSGCAEKEPDTVEQNRVLEAYLAGLRDRDPGKLLETMWGAAAVKDTEQLRRNVAEQIEKAGLIERGMVLDCKVDELNHQTLMNVKVFAPELLYILRVDLRRGGKDSPWQVYGVITERAVPREGSGSGKDN